MILKSNKGQFEDYKQNSHNILIMCDIHAINFLCYCSHQVCQFLLKPTPWLLIHLHQLVRRHLAINDDNLPSSIAAVMRYDYVVTVGKAGPCKLFYVTAFFQPIKYRCLTVEEGLSNNQQAKAIRKQIEEKKEMSRGCDGHSCTWMQ